MYKRCRMKTYILILIALIIIVSIASCHDTPGMGAATGKDSTTRDSGAATPKTPAYAVELDTAGKLFLKLARAQNLVEMSLGKLATVNGASARIKALGSSIAADYAEAGVKLKSLAYQLQVDDTVTITLRQEQVIRGMENLRGNAFDKAWITHLNEEYSNQVTQLEQAVKLDNNLLKDFAAGSLPVLRSYLDSARALAQKE
jgi:putative membrane protein